MKADKEMFINVSAGGTRIAITEGGKLVELHIERPDYQRMVGNIYKGKIQNVIPGMQAAFIDIGYESNRTCFGKPDSNDISSVYSSNTLCFQ